MYRRKRHTRGRPRRIVKVPSPRRFVVTRNSGHQYVQDWTIENALKFTSDSPIETRLRVAGRCKTRLWMRAKVTEERAPGYHDLEVFIERRDTGVHPVRVTYDLELKNSSGDVYGKVKSWWNLGSSESSSTRNVRVLSEKLTDTPGVMVLPGDVRDDEPQMKGLVEKELVFWDRDGVWKVVHLPGDHIHVTGHVTVHGCCVRTTASADVGDVSDGDDACAEGRMVDLEAAFRAGLDRGQNLDGFFPDAALRADDGVVRCHRFVLAARSPALRRELLQSGGAREIRTEGMDRKTLTAFLLYLYCDAPGSVRWSRLVQLYEAGVRYEVAALRSLCAKQIAKALKVRTVAEVLALSARFGDDYLKMESLHFAKVNYGRIVGTEEWKKFAEENPQLAMEAVTHAQS